MKQIIGPLAITSFLTMARGLFYIYYELAYLEDQILCLDKLTYTGNLETFSSIWDDLWFSYV